VTRQQTINFLINNPVRFAHMLGFTKMTDLHNGWIREMLRGRNDYTLQAHRGSYKTTCVSVALALIIILLPNKRVLFIRKTDADVKEVIKQVQKILLDPHTQVFVNAIYEVNLKLNVQSSTEVSTNLTTDIKGTSQLVGIGTGSSLTGKHFDYIFTDDIINVNDRTSKAERDRTKLIYQELQNIRNRGGRIFNTLTPWHPDSAESLMPNVHKFDCYSTGLITSEQLEEIKSQMLGSLFSCNYELRHVPAEDVIFFNPRTGGDPAMVEQGIAHVDAAYGGEDWTAFTVCRKYDGVYYVYGRCWRKHVDDCLADIIALRQAFCAGKIYCEDNGDKGYLAKEMRRRGERVNSYHESTNKYLKITSYLKGAWKDVVFVAGTDEAYIQQICDYNEEAEHDDCPDSLSSLVRILYRKQNSTESYVPMIG